MFPLAWGFLWGGGPSSLKKTDKVLDASMPSDMFYTVCHFPFLKGKKEEAELNFLQKKNIFDEMAKIFPSGSSFEFYKSIKMAKENELNKYNAHQAILVVNPEGLIFEKIDQTSIYKFPKGKRFRAHMITEIHIPYKSGEVVILKNPASKKLEPSMPFSEKSSPA